MPVAPFVALGIDVVHVTELGSQLTDEQVWDAALKRQRIIVTKDADFFSQYTLRGAPPKVVWIRTGNLRVRELQSRILGCWADVEEMLATADVVIIHGDRIEGLGMAV